VGELTGGFMDVSPRRGIIRPAGPIIGRQDSCISLRGKASIAGVIAGLAGENRMRYGSRAR
jgi:hypothetical protein